MTTIKESAESYEPRQTKNISDLDKIPVTLEIVDDEYELEQENGESKTIKQKVVLLNKEFYRVPDSVRKQLKAHLETRPNLKFFKVIREGTGLKTSYTVIPLDE